MSPFASNFGTFERVTCLSVISANLAAIIGSFNDANFVAMSCLSNELLRPNILDNTVTPFLLLFLLLFSNCVKKFFNSLLSVPLCPSISISLTGLFHNFDFAFNLFFARFADFFGFDFDCNGLLFCFSFSISFSDLCVIFSFCGDCDRLG